MLVVCASVSGAPGVSTAAVGLAAGWPQAGGLLLEADPSGGVAAARFGLAQQPGLASLAAAARHGGVGGVLSAHVQRLPLGVGVVVAPGSADVAAGSVGVLAGSADALRDVAPVVVADVGRLYPESPARALVAAADAVVLVTTPTTEYLDHLDARLGWLRNLVDRGWIGLAVSGRGLYPAAEIGARLALPVWAQLPRDQRGAAVLGGRLAGRTWHRTPLARALRDLAGTLHWFATRRDTAQLGALR
ncbi:hypothetical protein GCM10027290_29680 [Micromonospora sonneratiae]|uniref:MinD-like ATPase involved in chromosome partitioning or flagellar assembly n=1 Tax=Micromonospora sonneratiae TaxID=1184706 RepID=A0ABW3YIE3_9ACTN